MSKRSLMSKSWVSASSTRNWMLRDPLLDWLKMYKSPGGAKVPEIIRKDENQKESGPKLKASYCCPPNRWESMILL